MAGCYVEMVRVAGFKAWVLHDDEADMHATWVPGAGMLGASLVHHGRELLWQGDGVRGYARERSFMGIPFLHPWANRLAGFRYVAGAGEVVLDPASPLLLLDEHGLPIHGLLTASRRWSLSQAAADHDHARLIATLDFQAPELLAAFPFPHRLQMEVQLAGGAVEIRTTLTATGQEPVPIAFGYHPYLQIPGVPRARWEISFPVRRRLQLDRRQIPTGATEATRPLTGPIGERTWDDGFDRIDTPARFTVRGGQTTIHLEFLEGAPIAQIFAPPDQQYLCIEPMTAPTNALNEPHDQLTWAKPGHPHITTFRIAST